MIDTNVAIHVRDGDTLILDRMIELDRLPVISIVTRIELEGGISRNPAMAAKRRSLLDRMLETIAVLPFGDEEAAAYGVIVATVGYGRRRVLDRMIAAQAIVAEATLITINGADFRDVPGLKLQVWENPAPSR